MPSNGAATVSNTRGTGSWNEFYLRQFDPGTRVWIEIKAFDANGNRVGYATLTRRTQDTRSLRISPKGNRFPDRFSVHITDVPSATTGFKFRVKDLTGNKVIATVNFSTNPSSYDRGPNVISVCAQGCSVTAALKPARFYEITVIAYESIVEITRTQTAVGTSAVTMGNAAPAQAAPAQAAPASEPTATAAPIVLAAGIHNASEVTLQWSAVSGATGYELDYAGSDMKTGAYTLGAGATSQRITGLSPGATYRVTLTVTLPGGGKQSGEISFRMPDPPPPPTNTPVPPPPPTNTPVPPPPPTNTAVPPPPPPANTPVPPPPPTNTAVPPPPPQQSYSVPGSLIQTVRGYYDENVAAGRAGKNWLRVLIAFGAETHDELSPMSASEARERVSRWGGWKPVAEALEQLEGYGGASD